MIDEPKNLRTERPILFNTEMVKAILNNRKTQTRRLLKNRNAKNFKVGDYLWVKETFREWRPGCVDYKADIPAEDAAALKWKSSLFMHRKHSRLLLRITDIRTENLMSISDADAVLEGIKLVPDKSPRTIYFELWDKINDKPGTRTIDCPVVKVVTFEKVLT